MKSKVYFIKVSSQDSVEIITEKTKKLCQQSKVLDFIQEGDLIPIKTHFGEEGNTGFVKPQYIKVIAQEILKKRARTVVCDTNTLYKGKRSSSSSHLELAYAHGFSKENTGIDIFIPEDKSQDIVEVEIKKKYIRVAKVAKVFIENNGLVVISHFKGHLMTGFGGALKNLGMGCATREGKLVQHSDVSPIVYRNRCVGCGECVEICPQEAIRIIDKKSHIDSKLCLGCASCIVVCNYSAVDVAWEKGGSLLPDKMIEYAYAVLREKKTRVCFFNFLIKITKECDCIAKDDPRVAPDIGILASEDPVSIDKAGFDLVNKACGRNIFKELHPKRDALRQLNYAGKIGLGNLNYELIEIT